MTIFAPFADHTDQQHIQFLLTRSFIHINIKTLLNFTVMYVTAVPLRHQFTALACPVRTAITHTSSSPMHAREDFPPLNSFIFIASRPPCKRKRVIQRPLSRNRRMCGNKEQYMTCYYSVLGNVLACVGTGELASSVGRRTRVKISQSKFKNKLILIPQ